MSPSSSAHLEVLAGPLQGKLLSLTAPETVVGREVDDSQGLSLSLYREVSRRHARFYLKDGIWCVEDLGSTNGTFVNSARAAPAFSLSDGAMLQMGDFRARLRVGAYNTNAPFPGPTQPLPQQTPQSYPTAPGPVAPTNPGAVMPVAPMMPVVPVVPVAVTPYPVVYPMQPPKSVGMALLFSFLLVGGGQFYNGEAGKGSSMLCASVICGILAFFTCGITGLACPVIWVLSMVDAAQSAERINRATMDQALNQSYQNNRPQY